MTHLSEITGYSAVLVLCYASKHKRRGFHTSNLKTAPGVSSTGSSINFVYIQHFYTFSVRRSTASSSHPSTSNGSSSSAFCSIIAVAAPTKETSIPYDSSESVSFLLTSTSEVRCKVKPSKPSSLRRFASLDVLAQHSK